MAAKKIGNGRRTPKYNGLFDASRLNFSQNLLLLKCRIYRMKTETFESWRLQESLANAR